jgi:hypothetical protein
MVDMRQIRFSALIRLAYIETNDTGVKQRRNKWYFFNYVAKIIDFCLKKEKRAAINWPYEE